MFPRRPTAHPTLSLLWPPDVDPRHIARPPRLSADAAKDLDLDRTANALASAFGHQGAIRDILRYLCDDPAVIAYRQDILADLIAYPDLAAAVAVVLPRLHELESFAFGARPGQSSLYEVVWRVGQLEAYVEVVEGLHTIFAEEGRRVRAAGLIALRDQVATIAGDPTYQQLAAELPALIKQVRGIASITIGVNLDDQLRPVEATLIAVHDKKFQGAGASLLGSLFGRATTSDMEGIAPLHSSKPITPQPKVPGVNFENPLMYPLFRDLAEVLKKSVRPIATALGRYVRTNIYFLGDAGAELAFYLGAAQLIRRLHAAGLPTCRPTIVPTEARECHISGAYNLNLALRLLGPADAALDDVPDLRDQVIANAVQFDDEGRILVLTGPNQGGKTTYTQAVGLVHVLAGAGLFVPGDTATISPVDAVYTHFPVEERHDAGVGRLGEEAQRLNAIFEHATRDSLVLLNESLSSTSPGESLYLARDVVRALRMLGVRAIFATHLHDLAAGCDTINAETPGDSALISLVAQAVESDNDTGVRQTFRILPGPPRGRSYAREIAARYGISFEQLADLLHQRGVTNENDS